MKTIKKNTRHGYVVFVVHRNFILLCHVEMLVSNMSFRSNAWPLFFMWLVPLLLSRIFTLYELTHIAANAPRLA